MGMGSFVLLTLRWFYRFTCVAVSMQRSPGDDGLHVWSRSCFGPWDDHGLIGATKIYHRNWVPKLMDFVDPHKNPILSTLFRMLENIRLRPPGAGYHLASHEYFSPLALTLLWFAHSCRTGCVKRPGESEGPSFLHHSDLEPEVQVPHTFPRANFGQRLL